MLALVTEAFDELEVLGGVQRARHHGIPRVVDQVVALEGGQRCDDVAREPTPQLVGVRHAEEAVAARVHDDRSVVAGNPGLVAVEEDRLDLVVASDRQRDRPQRRRLVLVVEGEAALTQHELVTVDAGGHQGISGLPDPRVHDSTNWLA